LCDLHFKDVKDVIGNCPWCVYVNNVAMSDSGIIVFVIKSFQ